MNLYSSHFARFVAMSSSLAQHLQKWINILWLWDNNRSLDAANYRCCLQPPSPRHHNTGPRSLPGQLWLTRHNLIIMSVRDPVCNLTPGDGILFVASCSVYYVADASRNDAFPENRKLGKPHLDAPGANEGSPGWGRWEQETTDLLTLLYIRAS